MALSASENIEPGTRNFERWRHASSSPFEWFSVAAGQIESAAAVEAQYLVAAGRRAFQGDPVAVLIAAAVGGQINVNRLFSGHRLIFLSCYLCRRAAGLSFGERLFELRGCHMAS